MESGLWPSLWKPVGIGHWRVDTKITLCTPLLQWVVRCVSSLTPVSFLLPGLMKLAHYYYNFYVGEIHRHNESLETKFFQINMTFPKIITFQPFPSESKYHLDHILTFLNYIIGFTSISVDSPRSSTWI